MEGKNEFQQYPGPSCLTGLVTQESDPRALSEVRGEFGENCTVFSIGGLVRLEQACSP